MEAYKKKMEVYKEQKDKLDKNLGEFKSLLAKARQLEPNAETREFIASIENRSKSTLAKTEKLIANMEAEHEKFKEYLRYRGWLDRRSSHRNANFSSSLPQTDITSTSGRRTRNKSTKASIPHKKLEIINE
jgi:sugar-specific transcriptional regulator TrmB